MKFRFLILFCITFILYSCDSNEKGSDDVNQSNELINQKLDTSDFKLIGEVVDGEITLYNEKGIIKELEKVAIEQGYEVDYSQGMTHFDEDTKIWQYIAMDKSNETKTSMIIELSAGFVYDIGSSSCSCRGCQYGCSPRRLENGDCYCTKCELYNPPPSKCEKTESI